MLTLWVISQRVNKFSNLAEIYRIKVVIKYGYTACIHFQPEDNFFTLHIKVRKMEKSSKYYLIYPLNQTTINTSKAMGLFGTSVPTVG